MGYVDAKGEKMGEEEKKSLETEQQLLNKKKDGNETVNGEARRDSRPRGKMADWLWWDQMAQMVANVPTS